MTGVVRPSCFFCGQTTGPLTNEHVWPEWVSKLLFERCGPSDLAHFFRHVTATEDTTTPTGTSRKLDVTTRTVCRDCNCQWLSNFETRIKPLASPLIAGEGLVAVALAPKSQALVAAWAYKMAMLLEVAHPSTSTEFFTPTDRLRFRQTTSADEFVRVFLGRYEFGDRPALARKLRGTFAQESYWELTTITAGHLAMQVMSVRSVASNELVPTGKIALEFSGLAREALIPIWPPVLGDLVWPPAHTMSDQDIEDLAANSPRARRGSQLTLP